MRNSMKTLIIVMTVIFLNSCSGGGAMENNKIKIKSIEDIDKSDWSNLAKKKIYFGHQSVGNNILDGVQDIIGENPDIQLHIIESHTQDAFNPYAFAHSDVGQNINPDSKIIEFAKFMEKGLGNNADIAFMKFCFVDIHSGTDLQQIFNNYKTKMAELKKKYPETIFVHFTVPLTSNPTGLKAFAKQLKTIVKNIIGRIEMYDNTVKFKFNEMMRKEYMGKEPLFDLALYEAANRNGEVLTYKKNGRISAYTLRNEYTMDGGHLNETGRKFVAEQLLIFLLQLK